jgi:hypothetical protein
LRARPRDDPSPATVVLLEQLPGHDHALDLAGALADLGVFSLGDCRAGHSFEI